MDLLKIKSDFPFVGDENISKADLLRRNISTMILLWYDNRKEYYRIAKDLPGSERFFRDTDEQRVKDGFFEGVSDLFRRRYLKK